MKRTLALLLAFLMAASLLAACRSKEESVAGDELEEEIYVPEDGRYLIEKENGKGFAYIYFNGKKIIVLNGSGATLLGKSKYEYDADTSGFTIGGKPAFSVELRRKKIVLTVPKDSATGLPTGTYYLTQSKEDAQEEELIPADITIKHSCSFETDVTLNYKVSGDILRDYDSVWVEIEQQHYSGKKASYTERTLTDFSVENSNGTVVLSFPYDGFAAAEFGCDIAATVYVEAGGTVYYSPTDHYSIAQYAFALLGVSDSPAMLSLAVNILNFGASAQTFYNVDPGNLMNASLNDAQRALAGPVPALTDCTETVPAAVSPSAEITGKNCVIKNGVALKYHFRVASDTDPEGLRFVYSYTAQDGSSVTGESGFSSFTAEAEANTYSVTTGVIPLCDWSAPITAAVYSGDTQISDGLRYSVESYCVNAAYKTDNASVRALTDAMIAFSYAVKAVLP